MKHKLKNDLKLLALGLMLLFAFNCEKDDQSIIDESQLEQTTPIVLNQKIPFEQALHFNKVQRKISKLQTKITNLQSQNKINDEAIEIVTDEVMYITYIDTHTYTFKVLREAPTAYIENIVLHYNIETEDYNEYLVQYHVTADEFVNLHEGSLLQTSKNVTITNLEAGFFNNQTQSRGCDRVCSTIFVDCSSGDHHSGNVGSWGGCSALEAPTAYQSCGTVCNEITAPDGPSGGGNSTPYGSGGNVDNTAVVSSPMPNEPCKINENTGMVNAGGSCSLLEEECSPLDATNPLVQELYDAFGADNISPPCDIDMTNALSFDTIEEYIEFVEQITFSPEDSTSSLTNLQDGVVISNFRPRINSNSPLFGATLDIDIKSNLENGATNQEYEVIEIVSELETISPAAHWSPGAYIATDLPPVVTVALNGYLKFGIIIGSVEVVRREKWAFYLTLNKFTGEAVHIDGERLN